MSNIVKLEEKIEDAVESRVALYSIDKIATANEAERTALTLQWVKSTMKEVKADLKTITDPLNTALKAARAVAKKSLDPLSEGEKYGKRLLAEWDTEQREAAEEAKKALVETAKEGATGAELVKAAKAAQMAPKPASISYREKYTWECTDESIVPDEFKMLDSTRLGQYARAMKGVGKVPGIKFMIEKVVVSR